MRPLNIVILVLAGAIGGAVIMKVAQRPKVEMAAVEAPAPLSVTPAAKPEPPPAPPAAAEPVPPQQPAESKPAAPAASESAPAPQPARESKPKPPVAPAREAAKHTATRHAAPKVVYSSARPSPFEKEKAPPVEVAQAAPPAPAESPAPAAPAPAPVGNPTPPARTEPQAETPPPAPQPVPNSVTLNAGMLIPVRLVDGLSSERNAPGDAFLATLDRELVADGFVIAERGARVEGRVVTVDRGNRTHGGATLTVELTRLHTSDNQDVAIATQSFEKRSEPNRTTDAQKVGGGAVIGAIIGALAGGGAGAGDVLLTRKPATLPSETRVTFELRAPVRLTEKL